MWCAMESTVATHRKADRASLCKCIGLSVTFQPHVVNYGPEFVVGCWRLLAGLSRIRASEFHANVVGWVRVVAPLYIRYY